MTRRPNSDQGEYYTNDCSESDKCSLNNFDLLNIPAGFSRSTKECRPHPTTSERNDNVTRCQKGDYPRKNPDPCSSKACNSLSKSTISDTCDEKTLVYVYTDQEQKERSRNVAHYDRFLDRKYETRIPQEKKESSSKQLSEKYSAFPFRRTPSGNLKISKKQVAFQTNNLSVLIADPNNTTVDIEPVDEMPREGEMSKGSAMNTIIDQEDTWHVMYATLKAIEQQQQQQQQQRLKKSNLTARRKKAFGYSISNLNPLLVGKLTDAPIRKDQESTEYEGKPTDQILDPELNLNRLGYTNSEAIDWSKIALPEKRNLYLELYARITNFTNTDCKVFIDNEEINCHLIVLQCYSEVFHTYVAVKKVELPADKCSPASFAFIYEWMITGDPSYRELNRENVLDIFNAAKYLKIRDLIEQCWAFIDNQEVFDEDTAFLLYVDAKSKHVPEVRELMLPRVQRFFLMLVSSQDWLLLDLEDVMSFLRSNYICVNCEMEIFMSAVRWLRADWKNRDKHKVELFSCIRFGNIAPWQLVDIKRNPDNPDFRELTNDPEICKMIDDGLAFVIIKYWYGQENDDFQHWNSILALKEPSSRNWSGMDKTYFTYREFLIYLDQYRRAQMIEKNKPKESRCSYRMLAPEVPCSADASSEKMVGTVTARLPTMDEFLANKKSKQPKDSTVKSPLFTLADTKRTRLRQRPPMTRNKAARVIQATFRAYLAKRYAKQMSLLQSQRGFGGGYGGGVGGGAQKFKRTPPFVDRAQRAHEVHEIDQNRSHSLLHDDSGESEKLVYTVQAKQNNLFKTTERTNINQNLGYDENVSSNASDRVAMIQEPTAGNSATNLLPRQHKYLEGASLFLAERESVMVFGGVDPHNGYGTSRNTGRDVYRYLPKVNVWEYVGEMPAPRNHHNVAFLVGRVYVVGGADPREDDLKGKYVVVDTVWSFDPVKRSWFSEGSLKVRRKNFGLVVSNQNMYAIGGQDRHGRVLASVERYNPMTGAWEFQAPLLNPRMGVACAKHNGKIWAVGGMCGSKRKPLMDCVECFDVDRNQWTEVTKLRYPRCFGALFSMSDRLYLIGGAGRTRERDKMTNSLNEIDAFNEATSRWECQAEMAIPRHGHCVAYLGTQILIIGGVTTVYMRALSNTECYCTSRGTWVRGIACLPTTLSGHAAVTLPPAVLM